MDCFTPGTHGSTYGGNPLACKIAMTALDVILQEGMIENAAKMGSIFRAELTKRLDKNRAPEVRGKGLLNAVILNKGKRTNFYLTSFPSFQSLHIFHCVFSMFKICWMLKKCRLS